MCKPQQPRATGFRRGAALHEEDWLCSHQNKRFNSNRNLASLIRSNRLLQHVPQRSTGPRDDSPKTSKTAGIVDKSSIPAAHNSRPVFPVDSVQVLLGLFRMQTTKLMNRSSKCRIPPFFQDPPPSCRFKPNVVQASCAEDYGKPLSHFNPSHFLLRRTAKHRQKSRAQNVNRLHENEGNTTCCQQDEGKKNGFMNS